MKIVLKEDIVVEFKRSAAYFFIGCETPLAVIPKGTEIEFDEQQKENIL